MTRYSFCVECQSILLHCEQPTDCRPDGGYVTGCGQRLQRPSLPPLFRLHSPWSVQSEFTDGI